MGIGLRIPKVVIALGLGMPLFLGALSPSVLAASNQLAPATVSVQITLPVFYTESAFTVQLRAKLTPEEVKLVVNPLSSNPEMEKWARQITADATNEESKAILLFKMLASQARDRKQITMGVMRTAQEVFAAWNKPDLYFYCKDYALLYVALARCVGLKAYDVNVEEDVNGAQVQHDCAAVLLDGRILLVDPPYLWFGVPHKRFTVLDDLQSTALYLGQLPELESSKIAAKLAPNIFLVQLNLFEKLANENRLNEARKVLPAVRSLSTNAAIGDYAEARLALLAGNSRDAISLLQSAISNAPGIATYYTSLATAYAQEGRLDEAHESLKNALSCAMIESEAELPRMLFVDTNALAAWGFYNLGVGRFNVGKWDDAITSFDEALKLKPNSAVVYLSRGQAKRAKGDLIGARADDNKAVELNPRFKQTIDPAIRASDASARGSPAAEK